MARIVICLKLLKARKQFYLSQGSSATRRRDRRFLWLSLLLGSGIAMALAVGLYFMHQQR